MCELYTDLGPLSMTKLDYPLQRGDVGIGPYSVVFRRDAAFGSDGGGLDADGACPVFGEGAEVDEVEVGDVTVAGTVLAHRGLGGRSGISRIGPYKQRRTTKIRFLNSTPLMVKGVKSLGVFSSCKGHA
jgi:hypothetical protein